MRRYLRTLWDAICGRRVAEVEFSKPLRLTWKGTVGFEGRVVGYQISRSESLGGHEATVTLHDPDYDHRVLSMRVTEPEEQPEKPAFGSVEAYEQYGQPSHVEGVGRLRDDGQEAPDWTI